MSPRRHSPPCHAIQASLLAPVCTPAVTGSRGRPKKEPAPSRHGIQRPPPKGACTQPSWDPRLPAPVWLFPCASSAPVHHTAIELPQRSMPPLRPSSHVKVPLSSEPQTPTLCRGRCCRGRSRPNIFNVCAQRLASL
jgi:hypothetical protein